jgi:hypothetical protein
MPSLDLHATKNAKGVNKRALAAGSTAGKLARRRRP